MAKETYKEEQFIIDDILIPDDNPEYYYWYYNAIVRDTNGRFLSGVGMYDSSNTKVAISDKAGRISYYAGSTTTSNETFPTKFFTFKKAGYVDISVDITATPDGMYAPIVMSQIQILPDSPVYFDIFIRDLIYDLPISGAIIDVYTDPNYSKPFIHNPSLSTDQNGLGSVSTNLLSIGSTLYFQVSATGYTSTKIPVIGTGFHRLENEDSILRLSPEGSITREYVFRIKVLDSLQNPVPNVRLRLYEDFSLSSIYSNGVVEVKSEDGLYEIAERIKNIILLTVDLDVSILNDKDRLIDVGVDLLEEVDKKTNIDKSFRITISKNEVNDSCTISDMAE